VLCVHHVERNENPFIYFRAFDINHVGSIESQLRDVNSFHPENMQSCCSNPFLMFRHAERQSTINIKTLIYATDEPLFGSPAQSPIGPRALRI
jgi:hypothetical protein